MVISVNTIPSINVPFTDKQGRISPIWHEFLRSFVASSVDGTIAETVNTTSVTAGAGLTGGGTGAVTLAVAAGSGIAVDEDSVSVDFLSPPSVEVALEDSFLFADASDNNNIAKAQVRDIIELNAPGGSNTQVQYNNNGIFGADSGFTYNGAGTAAVSTMITVGSGMRIGTDVADAIHFAGTTGNAAARIQVSGSAFALHAATSGSETGNMAVGAAGDITFTFNGGRTLTMSAVEGAVFAGPFGVRRSVASPTAGTTQTQGQGALTRDYNYVATVANANDVVTLPTASAGGTYCVVFNGGANILQVFPASGDDLGAGVNTSITMRPGESYSWFNADATTWRPITGILKQSVASGLTASTTQTQGQQALTKDINEISVCANANDTVTLPSATAYGRSIRIINNGAQTLKIFPASGDNLGAGVDTSTTLASGANVCYTNYDSTNWENI